MANVRTHPAEWFRMLELLNTLERTDEEEQELKQVASIFTVGERKRTNWVAKTHMAVTLYDTNNNVVHRETSIRKMAEYLGMSDQTLNYKSKAQIPLNIEGYEGYIVVRKGDKLNDIAPDGMKKCVRCGIIKDKSEFISAINGGETHQCERCRYYYNRKYYQEKRNKNG